MSDISLGQAIGIIGGVPLLKNALGHTVDHLRIPRHLDIGNIGTAGAQQAILSSVLSSGIGSLLQSPLGSSLTSLTSGISAAAASLSSLAGGATPLVNALGSLSTSASSLSALADNLVGFASNAALPSQLDVIAHMGAVQSLGSSVPSDLSLATVLAPVQSTALLGQTMISVQSVVTQVTGGTMSVADATSAVTAMQATIDGVANASTHAVSTVQAAQQSLCAASSTMALLVGGSSEIVAAMNLAIRPDMLATVQSIVDDHNAALTV